MLLKKIVFGVLLVLSITILLFVIYGALHSWPNVEDLEHSIASRDLGVWRSLTNRAITHDGRFSTNFLHATNFLVFGKVSWYKYIIISSISLLFLSLLSAVWLMTNTTRLLIQICLVMLLSSFVLLATPSLYYSLYGISFSYIYLYPCIFLLFQIAIAYKFYTADENRKLPLFILLTCLIFIGVGFSELFLAFYASIAVLIPLYFWFYNQKYFKQTIPLSILTIAFVFFFGLTPGVHQRMYKSPNILFIYDAFVVYLSYLKTYLFNPSSLLVLLFGVLFHKKFRFHLNDRFHTIGFILLFLIIPYLMTLPFYFANTGFQELAERIYVPISFMHITCLVFIIGPSLGGALFEKFKTRPNTIVTISCLFLTLVVAANLYQGKGSVGLLILESRNGQIKVFSQFMEDRYQKLDTPPINTEGVTVVCLDELKDFPSTLFCFQDFQNNRRDSKWNRFIEGYFNIDEVRVYGPQTNKFEF